MEYAAQEWGKKKMIDGEVTRDFLNIIHIMMLCTGNFLFPFSVQKNNQLCNLIRIVRVRVSTKQSSLGNNCKDLHLNKQEGMLECKKSKNCITTESQPIA